MTQHRRKSLKPCKSYQYRNPSTNRCRNYKNLPKGSPKRKSRRQTSKKLVPCKSHQYRNPSTNRCRNYKNLPKGSPKRKSRRRTSHKLVPCKSYQYRDPSTNRCRNKELPPLYIPPPPPTPLLSKNSLRLPHTITPPTPPVSASSSRPLPPSTPPLSTRSSRPLPPSTPPLSRRSSRPLPPPTPPVSTRSSRPQRSVQNKITPVGPGISENFKKLAENCSEINNWKKDVEIGHGSYGYVYQICKASDETDCNYVMKIQPLNEGFYQEVYALEDLQSTGVVQKLYSAWACGDEGFIVTELLKECDNISNEEKYKQIKNALEEMKKKGWLHVDLHEGNILCGNDGKKVIMIDFGWAVKKGDKGDDTLYPKHPLVGRITPKNVPLTWKQLENVQEINLQYNLNDRGVYNLDDFLEAYKIDLELSGVQPEQISEDIKIIKGRLRRRFEDSLSV